jgi:hypothetical protein
VREELPANVQGIGMIDDHSRPCLAAEAFAHDRAPDLVSTLYEAASRYGAPESLLSDNGAVYAGAPRAEAAEAA